MAAQALFENSVCLREHDILSTPLGIDGRRR
jgi:hypothetical protein